MTNIWFKRTLIWTYDLTLSLFSCMLAYWFFPSFLSSELSHWQQLLVFPISILIFQISFNYHFNVYRGYWRFASIIDLVRIIKSALLTATLAYTASLAPFFSTLPLQIIILYAIFSVFFLAGGRLCYRLLYNKINSDEQYGKRVLIVGSDETAEFLIRDMVAHKREYTPIAMISEKKSEKSRELHGVRVIGHINQMPEILIKHCIELVVVASASATSDIFSECLKYCNQNNIPLRTIASIDALMKQDVNANKLREVSIEDLLGRKPIQLNRDKVSTFINGKCILITGGGGSIGSELCRQVTQLNPRKLVIIDQNEFNLYSIEQELAEKHPEIELRAYLTSVTDTVSIKNIFMKNDIGVIFHAAAYKHVPLLEDQPVCAIQNNVLGTKIMATLASDYNVKHFVLISTDKAVAPCNVMGATKRLCEMICQHFNKQSKTKYITVRFGNVLGSVGSVIPLFKKQIRSGGPITLTDEETTRYFMTIPEASQLILQASCQGNGGEVFVLDMGKPVKILDLAQQLTQLMGEDIDKIGIKVTGLRKGERLHEDLFYQDEQLQSTIHNKIFKAMGHFNHTEYFNDLLTALEQQCANKNDKEALRLLTKIVCFPTGLEKKEKATTIV